MPPRYLRKGTTKLKPCSEFTVEACDLAPADQCCGSLPCALCLEWETYADGISYGTATFGGSSWTGTVGGLAFVSYWERDAYGECEYVVILDGEEVYRATCYEGASCRDPGGSVGVTIGYDEGTLTWTKHEPRPLALTTDPDTGCNDFFCGTCRCSCECLCVTITEVGIVTGRGEICTTAYPCDAPVWEGTVGYYDLSIALGRDQYTGECIITLTADGDEQEPVFVTGCADMSATVTLYDGTIISVACKDCSNCSGTVVYPCECRRDGDAWVATRSAGTSPCAIDNPAMGYTDPNGVPESKRAWNVGDCVFAAPLMYLITAFPPFCIDPRTSRFLVFVQKLTSETTPFIDNSQVQENEWYAVVYDDVTFDIVGISYEYSTCCKNETPEDAATSHLIWVQWDNLPVGGGLEYTIRMTNINAVAAYGTC